LQKRKLGSLLCITIRMTPPRKRPWTLWRRKVLRRKATGWTCLLLRLSKMRMSEADWDAVINVNLKSVFNCTQAIIRPMVKQRSGKIVNISSVVGQIGNAGQANYSASKAGIMGFTKTVAREVAARGINVNAVAPGFIDTEMTAVLSEKIKESFVQQIPLGKLGKPEDVAEAVYWLCSGAAAYITGQVIHVSGGMYM
ncbi:MAG: SDR family oxidoreductase, partial [Deltaproteobacteria bacterium]|nr:SDR family oxidoreductase [Deltaproteobacteria bacterium]